MIQDAPVAGTPLSVPLLARMAREIPNVSYFKVEVAQVANKLRALIAEGGDAIVGPLDGPIVRRGPNGDRGRGVPR